MRHPLPRMSGPRGGYLRRVWGDPQRVLAGRGRGGKDGGIGQVAGAIGVAAAMTAAEDRRIAEAAIGAPGGYGAATGGRTS